MNGRIFCVDLIRFFLAHASIPYPTPLFSSVFAVASSSSSPKTSSAQESKLGMKCTNISVMIQSSVKNIRKTNQFLVYGLNSLKTSDVMWGSALNDLTFNDIMGNIHSLSKSGPASFTSL